MEWSDATNNNNDYYVSHSPKKKCHRSRILSVDGREMLGAVPVKYGINYFINFRFTQWLVALLIRGVGRFVA